MRLAHVRALDAPPGFPWRLAAAIDGEGHRWLDLEQARERAIATRPTLARTDLHGDPVSTLDGHPARGLRVSALRDVSAGFAPRRGDPPGILAVAGLRFGPPILAPRSLRDFFAFERHAAT